jgi:hypothetical protein
MVVRCIGACLDHKDVSIYDTWRLWTSEYPLDLLRLNSRLQLRVIYPYMYKYEPRLKCAIHDVQSKI